MCGGPSEQPGTPGTPASADGPGLREQRFQAIYDSVNDGILILDPVTSAILDVNRRVREWFGYATQELLELDLGRLAFGLWPYTRETAQEWVRKAAEGTPQTFEWLCTTRGGNLIWLDMNLRMADLGGQDRLVATAGNITQRKRIEMENAARLKRAEAQNSVSLALAGVGPDYAAALRLIAHHLAVQVGDLCTLDLLGADGRLHPSELAQPYVGGEALLPDYRQLAPLALGGPGAGQVAQSGQALRLEGQALEQVLPLVRTEFQPYFERFRIHSLMVVPMRTEGRTIGTISLAMGGASRPYSVEDQAVIQNLADRAALTITNAQLYAQNLAQAKELKKTNQELERRVEARTAELEQANARLQQMAMEDGLTRLANRRLFDSVLEKEIRRAMRNGDPLALIMGDVDFFKRYNDRHGHVAGDLCLQEIGAVLKSVFRRVEELPARYGGEEFAVILPGADPERAQAAAEKLLHAVEARQIPHGNSEVGPYVTLSLGFVCAPVTAATTPDWFITWADEGLYRSKAEGRNRVTSAN
jgi:diguanylate cyclase (GGDEF)-like protein/PAS domain S-box-containing protein